MYALMAMVYILFGQDRLPSLVFLNNTEQAIVITSQGGVCHLPFQAVGETKYPAAAQAFTVQVANGASWKYKWMPLDRSFEFRNRICFQVEVDGTIYVLPRQTYQVTNPLPSQPKGYPLKPG
jgi:hypothetical protein